MSKPTGDLQQLLTQGLDPGPNVDHSWAQTRGNVAIQINEPNNTLGIFEQKSHELKTMVERFVEEVITLKKIQDHFWASPLPTSFDPQDAGPLESQMARINAFIAGIILVIKEIEYSIATDKEACERTWRFAKLFDSTLCDYTSILLKYRDGCKFRIKHGLMTIGVPSSDVEMEKLFQNGVLPERIFTQATLQLPCDQATQTLADIQARHNDMIKLEKPILELNGYILEIKIFLGNMEEIMSRIVTNRTLAQAQAISVETGVESSRPKSRCCSARMWGIKFVIIIILVVLRGALTEYKQDEKTEEMKHFHIPVDDIQEIDRSIARSRRPELDFKDMEALILNRGRGLPEGDLIRNPDDQKVFTQLTNNRVD